MDFDPNIDEMTAHFALLYNWTQTAYPKALFEVRCIHPTNGVVKDARFACTPDGYEQAVWFAVQHNDQGYNVYTTVNPLRPNTAHTANDTDVEVAIYHCVDADGVDDPDALIAERSQGFMPTFTTLTGTTPRNRAAKSIGSRVSMSPICQLGAAHRRHWRSSLAPTKQ